MPMLSTDLKALHGSVVLVRSAEDHRNPQTAIRGSIEIVDDSAAGQPVVRIALDFPQMFTTRAHHRTITLNEAEISRLLASEDNGAFEFTLPGRIDPEAPPGNE